jgi:hypothetical protein
MFAVSFAVSLFLGIYLTNVLGKGEDEAMRLKWYYPLTVGYWRGTRAARVRVQPTR